MENCNNVPNRGRPRFSVKAATTLRKCCFGVCPNNNRVNLNVQFYPFPKPCVLYRSLTSPTHDINLCIECNTAAKWLNLCKRSDKKFTSILQINWKTFICGDHFIGGNGPTLEFPDPVPANANLNVVTKLSRKRKSPMKRTEPIKNKRKKLTANNTGPSVCGQDMENFSSTSVEESATVAMEVPISNSTINDELIQFGIQCAKNNWAVSVSDDAIKLQQTENFVVAIQITIFANLTLDLLVYGKSPHVDLPTQFSNVGDVRTFFERFKHNYQLCYGNRDENLLTSFKTMSNCRSAYFCSLTGSVKSVNCPLLVKKPNYRCDACDSFRGTLRKSISRKSMNQKHSSTKKLETNFRFLSKDELIDRIKHFKIRFHKTEIKLKRTKAKIDQIIKNTGVTVHSELNSDFQTILSNVNDEENQFKT